VTLDELKQNLEKLISDLSSSGFGNVDSGITEKLNNFAAAAGELGFNEGKHLIENLSGSIKSIMEGKSQAESGFIRLTALEFHLKKLTDDASTEDLEDL
jgi:hypothetical protein